jgi:hypothetical protein
MPTDFKYFAKLSGLHAYPCRLLDPPLDPGSMAAERWRGYRLWRASMRFHMRKSTCWRRLTLALLVWSTGTLLFCNCCQWLLKYMVSRLVFNFHIIDVLAVTIFGLLIMITLFVHELQFYLTTYTVHQVWLATAYIFMFDCSLLYATFQCNIHRDFCSPLQIYFSFFPRHCEYACRKQGLIQSKCLYFLFQDNSSWHVGGWVQASSSNLIKLSFWWQFLYLIWNMIINQFHCSIIHAFSDVVVSVNCPWWDCGKVIFLSLSLSFPTSVSWTLHQLLRSADVCRSETRRNSANPYQYVISFFAMWRSVIDNTSSVVHP